MVLEAKHLQPKPPIYTIPDISEIPVIKDPLIGIFPNTPRFAVIEDGLPQIRTWVKVLHAGGIEAIPFLVNEDNQYSVIEQHVLARAVINTGVQYVVGDKGLGYVRGYEVLDEITQAGRTTLLFTGEPDTREIHRTATYYMEKSGFTKYTNLIIFAYKMLGLSKEQTINALKIIRKGPSKRAFLPPLMENFMWGREMSSIGYFDSKTGKRKGFTYDAGAEEVFRNLRLHNAELFENWSDIPELAVTKEDVGLGEYINMNTLILRYQQDLM